MTVIFKEETGEGRSGSNEKGIRRYSRAFRLETTSQMDGPYAVGSDANLPVIGSLHPEDMQAWCVSLRVENSNPWKGWTVTAEYTSEREITEDPTAEPAAITWSSEQFQRPVIYDNSGNAVVNSAGDPFDPPIMRDDSRPVITISKNLAVVPVWIMTYQDAVNSDAFYVDGVLVGAGLAKVQSVSVGEVQRRNGIMFRVVNLVIHLQRNGWLIEAQDVGFRELGYGGRQNILNDVDSQRPSAPVPLDGAGAHIVSPTAATNVTLSFSVYSTQVFSALPLS